MTWATFPPVTKAPSTQGIGGQSGPKAGLCGVERHLFPLIGIEHRFLHRPAHSLVTTTTLSRLILSSFLPSYETYMQHILNE